MKGYNVSNDLMCRGNGVLAAADASNEKEIRARPMLFSRWPLTSAIRVQINRNVGMPFWIALICLVMPTSDSLRHECRDNGGEEALVLEITGLHGYISKKDFENSWNTPCALYSTMNFENCQSLTIIVLT